MTNHRWDGLLTLGSPSTCCHHSTKDGLGVFQGLELRSYWAHSLGLLPLVALFEALGKLGLF